MPILAFLNEKQCRYRVTEHEPVDTAEQLAEAEHVSPRNVAKPVVVQAEGRYYLCVLPADCRMDLYAVAKHLGAETIRLASEQEVSELFKGSETGAEPPLGNLYNLPTLMDKKLSEDKYILFQAGNHHQAVWMSMDEYKRLTNPEIFGFGYPEIIDKNEFISFDPFF